MNTENKTGLEPEQEQQQTSAEATETLAQEADTAGADHSEEMTSEDSDEVSALQAEVEQLKAQLAQKEDQILRKIAEFDNMKRRTQRERIQLFDDAKMKAVADLLPVYDDLGRSLQNVPEDTNAAFADGVKMVHNKFSSVLEKMGVEPIDETGIPFNVELHDALMRQPAPDENTESNTVLQVLETGYKLGEKVIRHAKVIVSQ
ncbi:nucleotide exchange factor GrpE [Cyclonatronum proteinivorum]|nr:nucleotide exchange factor GrpE [Cyclonatronum proteinivorum]